MGYFLFDNEETIKIKEKFNEDVKKIENLKDAIDLLEKVRDDFLQMYDRLVSDLNVYKRRDRESKRIFEEDELLRKNYNNLLLDYAKLEIRYKDLLEIIKK